LRVRGVVVPICVKEGLPAIEILANENIFIMSENRAKHQDIRELRILIVNLMPTVISTETQLLRLLSNTSLQINVEFLKISHRSIKNSILEHLHEFYLSFDEIKENNYDGMIVTGAPVEKDTFENVEYWNDLCQLMDWAQNHVYSALYICWGAQAALYHRFGLSKAELKEKVSGVYPHTVNNPRHPIVRGFDDVFFAPHSRYTSISKDDVLKIAELELLAESEEAGVYLISDKSSRQLYVTGHCEFDRLTLKSEYARDFILGMNPRVPQNYDLKSEATISDQTNWSSHAALLFTNWLNYYVYQQTPFHLKEMMS
jgi:homoserine O-succinyltransferase